MDNENRNAPIFTSLDITCKHEPALNFSIDNNNVNEKHEADPYTPKKSSVSRNDPQLISTSTFDRNTHPPTSNTTLDPASSFNKDSEHCMLKQPAQTPPQTMDAVIQEPQGHALQSSFAAGYNEQEFMSWPPSTIDAISSSSSSLSEFLLIGHTDNEDSESGHSLYEEESGKMKATSRLSRSQAKCPKPTPCATNDPSSNRKQIPQRDSRRASYRRSHVLDEENEQCSDDTCPDYHRQPSSRSRSFHPPHQNITDHETIRRSSSPSMSKSATATAAEPYRIQERPSSPKLNDKARRRRSAKSSTPSSAHVESDTFQEPTTPPSTPPSSLHNLQWPSLRGITKSIVEFVVAAFVCVSLVSVMFAFSYVSTGTKHLLGWYSEQQFGQRIRERVRQREHFVQEALEKMAGEEYLNIKRSRHHFQQQQQQQHPYGQQHHHHHQHQQPPFERETLSNAEWQELIRAASMNFLAKFSLPVTRR
ncbi:hypothetical protein BGZ94_003600 [Podila epigama]|nr:hypothetical protein BGZ94_003600 [Podila epigama]